MTRNIWALKYLGTYYIANPISQTSKPTFCYFIHCFLAIKAAKSAAWVVR